MIKKFLFTLIFIVIYLIGFSQQLIDYFTYYQTNFEFNRGYHFINNDINESNVEYYGSNARSLFDGENLYFINNFIGDIKFVSYLNEKTVNDFAKPDSLSSQLYFIKYNLTNNEIITKPFGSNFLNTVWKIKMDNEKKSICAIVSTCDDTVRLNPSNQQEFIAFNNRLQRFWILVFDLEGKLISKSLLAQSDYSYNRMNRNINLFNIGISKFNYLGDIIISFANSSNIKKIISDSVQTLLSGDSDLCYKILCYNQQKSKYNWLRKLYSKNFQIINSDISGIDFAAFVSISNTNKYIKFATINDKLLFESKFENENIKNDQTSSYIFKFDFNGNIIPVLNTLEFGKRGNSSSFISGMIENDNEVLLIYSTPYDSIKIFNDTFLGEKNIKVTKESKFILLKININNESSKVLTSSFDSIVPLEIFNAKNGFYVLYSYENKKTGFNILIKDSTNNYNDDELYKHPEYSSKFYTICKYNKDYSIKWLNKCTELNNIFDIGEKTVFDIAPFTFYDLNFKPESSGMLNPNPIMMMAGIYNCKPISYFRTIEIEQNTVKFTNLSEYNCSYNWNFGDGTSTTQKSPYHKFKSNTASYKVTLIATNNCGSDTFYRYYSPAGIAALKTNRNIKIYPNPLSGNTFNINIPETEDITSIKIYNTAGVQVDECDYRQNTKTEYSAILSTNLTKGIYFVRIILNNNIGFVSKLLVD